jgi:hypothetical protein
MGKRTRIRRHRKGGMWPFPGTTTDTRRTGWFSRPTYVTKDEFGRAIQEIEVAAKETLHQKLLTKRGFHSSNLDSQIPQPLVNLDEIKKGIIKEILAELGGTKSNVATVKSQPFEPFVDEYSEAQNQEELARFGSAYDRQRTEYI